MPPLRFDFRPQNDHLNPEMGWVTSNLPRFDFSRQLNPGCHLDSILAAPDPVICYFAFPRLGMAVALRPGDFLLFNPQEHHCISSRCQNENEIYSMSSYLKTAIVGLNDNSNTTV